MDNDKGSGKTLYRDFHSRKMLVYVVSTPVTYTTFYLDIDFYRSKISSARRERRSQRR